MFELSSFLPFFEPRFERHIPPQIPITLQKMIDAGWRLCNNCSEPAPLPSLRIASPRHQYWHGLVVRGYWEMLLCDACLVLFGRWMKHLDPNRRLA